MKSIMTKTAAKTIRFILWMEAVGVIPRNHVCSEESLRRLKAKRRAFLGMSIPGTSWDGKRGRIAHMQENYSKTLQLEALREVKARRAWKRDRGLAVKPIP